MDHMVSHSGLPLDHFHALPQRPQSAGVPWPSAPCSMEKVNRSSTPSFQHRGTSPGFHPTAWSVVVLYRTGNKEQRREAETGGTTRLPEAVAPDKKAAQQLGVRGGAGAPAETEVPDSSRAACSNLSGHREGRVELRKKVLGSAILSRGNVGLVVWLRFEKANACREAGMLDKAAEELRKIIVQNLAEAVTNAASCTLVEVLHEEKQREQAIAELEKYWPRTNRLKKRRRPHGTHSGSWYRNTTEESCPQLNIVERSGGNNSQVNSWEGNNEKALRYPCRGTRWPR